MSLENFIPIDAILETPEVFRPLLQSRNQVGQGTVHILRHAGNGFRPDNDGMHNGELNKWSLRFRGLNYHNQIRSPDGSPIGHHNINEDVALRREIDSTLTHLATENKAYVITPFVDEDSAALATSYNASLVGTENILAVEAGAFGKGNREPAIQKVLATGVEVVSQPSLLEKLPWRQIREVFGIIPRIDTSSETYEQKYETEMNTVPNGSKGETMFSGILTFFVRDKIARINQVMGYEYNPKHLIPDDAWIIFHDTDITNVEEYGATEYLAIPMLNPSFGQHERSIQIARHGAGRNNDTMMETASKISDPDNIDNLKIQMLGRTLESLSWHLSGERALRWSEIKNMVWCNGMGIETLLNMVMAGRDITVGTRGVAQVANPNPKIEIAISDPKREKGMIYSLARWMFKVAKFCDLRNKLPNEFDENDIYDYNTELGGKSFTITVPDEYSDSGLHDQMVDVEKRNEYLFPSLNTLYEMGFIDLALFVDEKQMALV